MDMNLIVNICVSVVFVAALILLWRKGYKKQVKEILLVLVIQAEKAWGSGTGIIKFSDVYNKLPTIVTILFTKREIETMINDTVSYMKQYLELNINAKKVLS